MKIALLAATHPKYKGGAELFYDGLQTALQKSGQDLTRIDIPVDESSFVQILEAYRHVSELDLSSFDVVLSTKAPTYNISHPGHILYLVHTMRVFYDMFGSWSDGSELSRTQRDQIREMDFRALSRIPRDRRFAIGHEVAERMEKYLGLSSHVLHPPLPDSGAFRSGQPEHFFHAGRLHAWKRVDLVLDAFLSINEDIDLLVSGTGEEELSLRKRAAGCQRVRFLGDVSRSQLYEFYAKSLAVPFVPVREDYGFVAVEAMMSGVPVITTKDSGEPARMIEHEKTGLIVTPDSESIAGAMWRLLQSPEEARMMGREGRRVAERKTWSGVIHRIMMSVQEKNETAFAHSVNIQSGSHTSCRLLIVDSQPIEPPVGGGRIRLRGLYSNLPRTIRPHYVGTYDWPGEEYRTVLHQNRLLEITVPQSPAHFEAHETLRRNDPNLSMDVTFPLLSPLSTGYVERVAYELSRADVLVLSHPWAWPVIAQMKHLNGKPLYYDAQNVETVLQSSRLASTSTGRMIAALVEKTERELCERVDGIFACSEEDAKTFSTLFKISKDRIHVIPNGVDTGDIHPATVQQKRKAREKLNIPREDHVAVFVGSLFDPNVEAAHFICERLAPLFPRVLFLIVGGCSSGVTTGVPSNVRLLGQVSNSLRNDAYRASDLALNPVIRGSGSNIKMMDFLSAGLPVITTPVGARGISWADQALIVMEREQFETAVRGLMKDPPYRHQLGRRARLLAELRYEWKNISAQLSPILQAKLEKPSSHPKVKKETVEPRMAILSTWQTRCGIADYTNFFVRSLPSRVSWSIYAEAGTCKDTDNSRVSANWNIGLHDLNRLKTSIARDRISLLLIQHNPAFFAERELIDLLRLCKNEDVKTAITFHALQALYFGSAFREELSRVDRIFVHRQSDVEWLKQRGIEKDVRQIPHGIQRFKKRNVAEAQQALGLEDDFVIGHFGYIRPYKGTLNLLEAFDLVAREMSKARLLLVCSEYPGPDSRDYLELCSERIAASPFKDRIHVNFTHLPLRRVIHLLQACNLIVYPYHSSKESSSAAVRPGIAAGRPILVSNSPIFEEVRDVATVMRKNTGPELAKSILALANDPAALSDSEKRLEMFAASHDWSRVSSIIWGHLKFLFCPENVSENFYARSVFSQKQTPEANKTAF